MIRMLTIAAAAALISAPAFAQSVRIDTAGQSHQQVQADIRAAARKVCERQEEDAPYLYSNFPTCVKYAEAHAGAASQSQTSGDDAGDSLDLP
jgi:hypothetical protein